jgi:hypothetical protein
MVMFLLSLQTGLIELKMPNRIGAMTIILFIVAASLLQTLVEVNRKYFVKSFKHEVLSLLYLDS